MEQTIFLPDRVKTLLQRLREGGFAAYAVGGCVRDSLLGLTPQDWDLCTDARPDQTAACFSDLRTVLTGAQYGTVTVILDEQPFEITTFRAESGYSDRRHPDGVLFLGSLREDLSRRDFTVNAMAAGEDGRVIDCFGGAEDLKNGVLRCVGDPEKRFSEDALRMLRALRFAARLGFSIEEATAAAIHAQKDALGLVAPERLKKELTGLLCGPDAARLLAEYADVVCVPIPELRACMGFRQFNHHHAYDVWGHTLAALNVSEPEPLLRLAVLLHDIGKPSVFTFDKQLVGHFYGHATVSAAMTENILRRLRFDGETVRRVTALVAAHNFHLFDLNEKRIRRLLSKYGETTLRQLLRLRRADVLGKGLPGDDRIEGIVAEAESLIDRVLSQQDCFSLAQLAVNGDDLLAIGIPRGRAVGLLLQRLLDAVVDGTVSNEREALVQYAQYFSSEAKTN